ncbi:MAG: glycosyltransferase, partial [Pseudomonadota bacterium]
MTVALSHSNAPYAGTAAPEPKAAVQSGAARDATGSAVPKVTVVIGAMNRGGCERHLVNTLPGLKQHGFDIEVFTLTERGELADELDAAGVPVIGPQPLDSASKPRRITRIASRTLALHRHFRRRTPDIVHFFLPHAYLLGGPAALLNRVPVRIMSRRSRNHYQARHPIASRAERLLHRRMTMVLGNSQAVIDDLIKEGVPDGRREIIYNGVKLPAATRAPEDVKAELGIPADTVVMTIVANLIGYKGHADLLDALATVRGDIPWRCLIVGEDRGIGTQLSEQVATLRLEQHVSFLGQRRDVPDLLAASDIGLLSSHEEGFSNAVLESMAASVPMIVTDVGGNSEAVRHEETGLVVPSHAPAAFAAAIDRLLGDAELRQTMGAAGSARVQNVFSEASCIAAYNALYARLLATAQ